MKRGLLFRRDFTGYTGGHGKVWDYYRHTAAHPAWEPAIHFTAETIDTGNPWREAGLPGIRHDWAPHHYDALFLAGMDWEAWPVDDPAIPVINLVQHVRHACPDGPLYGFLRRPATRICVSQSVADAIMATGMVDGPVHVIDAGLDLPGGSRVGARSGIVVGALKQPGLGARLADALTALGLQVRLLDALLPRGRYLEALAEADIAVLLPNPSEGFYLPALEAMALGCAVVVPDCVGNRAYLEPSRNALVPQEPTLDALLACVQALQSPLVREPLRAQGQATAARFTLAREAAAFHAVLDGLPVRARR
jgi:glycosyltransferase involved in cell wall biosynthesis